MPLHAREAVIKTVVDTRHRRRHQLTLKTEMKGSPLNASGATICNISQTGLLIETDSPISIGEVIELELPHAGSTPATVVWISGDLVGCKFNNRLSRGALSAAKLSGAFDVPADGGWGSASADHIQDSDRTANSVVSVSPSLKIAWTVGLSALLWTAIITFVWLVF